MDQAQQAEICARIKQARIEAGFTLQDAADALGISLRAYQHYEADRVPFRRLAEIGVLFNVDQDWVLRGRGAPGRDADANLQAILDRLQGLEAQVSVGFQHLEGAIAELDAQRPGRAAAER